MHSEEITAHSSLTELVHGSQRFQLLSGESLLFELILELFLVEFIVLRTRKLRWFNSEFVLEHDDLYQPRIGSHSLREIREREACEIIREERIIEYRYFVVRQRLRKPVWDRRLVKNLSGKALERLALVVVHEHHQLSFIDAHLEFGGL